MPQASAADVGTALLLKAVTALVLAYVGVNLAVTARRMATSRSIRARTMAILRGLRLRHFLSAPLVLTAVLALAVVLDQVPGLDFGWWTFIGGQGNPVLGQTDATSGTPLEWLIPLVFVVMLIPCLPLFAEREERGFRMGAEQWSWGRRLRRSVEFGLVHALIGIPIGVALALSLGGVHFTLAYLRGWRKTGNPEDGLLESTRTHLAYNLTIVLIVLPALFLVGRLLG